VVKISLGYLLPVRHSLGEGGSAIGYSRFTRAIGYA